MEGAFLIAALGISAHAGSLVFEETFESYKPGEFTAKTAEKAEPNGILASDAGGVAAAIIAADKTANTTRHLELTAQLANPGFNIAGISWKPSNQSGKGQERSNLAEFTLSFDLAIPSGVAFGTPGLELDVNVVGVSTGTGALLTSDVSKVVVGKGFQRITISLDQAKQFLETPALKPAETEFRVEFNMVGGVPASTGQKIAIDNIELTRKPQGK